MLPRTTKFAGIHKGAPSGPYSANEIASITDADIYRPDAASTYVLLKDWHGKMVAFPGECTVTIPADLPDGFSCGWSQDGADAITFVAGDGVAIQSENGYLASAGQYALGGVAKWGAGAFRLYGSLAEAS